MTALHGFLGQPADWDGILGDNWHKPNWLANLKPEPNLLNHLAQELNQRQDETLLGYSMGGRIALHMLIQKPQPTWKRAIIISASPGLSPNEDKETRIKNDQTWAEKFLNGTWDETIQAWNSQPVFAHDPPDRLPRLEKDYSREALAAALTHGSVALQSDLREALKTIQIPILWIAGEKDEKYTKLAQECAQLNPLFEVEIITNAGHRAPWGNPTAFQEAIRRFTLKP